MSECLVAYVCDMCVLWWSYNTYTAQQRKPRETVVVHLDPAEMHLRSIGKASLFGFGVHWRHSFNKKTKSKTCRVSYFIWSHFDRNTIMQQLTKDKYQVSKTTGSVNKTCSLWRHQICHWLTSSSHLFFPEKGLKVREGCWKPLRAAGGVKREQINDKWWKCHYTSDNACWLDREIVYLLCAQIHNVQWNMSNIPGNRMTINSGPDEEQSC